MWRLWRPGKILRTVDGLEPRLESWNRKDDPDQIRLRSYLADLMLRVGPLPSDQPLFLSLVVDVKARERLLRFHDLENYLFPLFRTGCFRPGQFVLAFGTKRVGGGSSLQVGVAQLMDGKRLSGWAHHACSAGSGTQTKAWKERIRSSLTSAVLPLIRDGPVAVQPAWRGARRRNWTWLWKPTGDAMGPVLGETRLYNPLDDRIVELHLHWGPDDSLGYNVEVGMWWRSAFDQLESVTT